MCFVYSRCLEMDMNASLFLSNYLIDFMWTDLPLCICCKALALNVSVHVVV
uniref:Uncharacterized protein n=1 Tax=Anguilla anguilla TaxID=7936 RepID=A0A0E9QVF2_ANGAN